MSLWLLILSFIAAACVVWWAGSHLPHYVVAISERTGLGQGFAGMLLLGGITSLPEVSTTLSAASLGASSLALNNVLGSVAFNIVLLALADMVLGRRPLTSVVARPVTLIQGVLGIMLLAVVATAIGVGEVPFLGVGVWSSVLLILCVAALGLAHRSERRPMWMVVNPPTLEPEGHGDEASLTPRQLVWGTFGLAMLILAAGTVLANTGDAIALRTGIGGGLVGLIFLALATSLPELSSITAAVRQRRYELAVGEVFGSNLFNLTLIFLIDLASPGPPVLAAATSFEIVAALLGLMLTGLYVLGLIERRDRTFVRMGYDSIAAIVLYGLGLFWLVRIASPG